MEHGIIGWLFIIVALIFIFGGSKRLEDLGKGFGGFMREFNKAKTESQIQAEVALARSASSGQAPASAAPVKPKKKRVKTPVRSPKRA